MWRRRWCHTNIRVSSVTLCSKQVIILYYLVVRVTEEREKRKQEQENKKANAVDANKAMDDDIEECLE